MRPKIIDDTTTYSYTTKRIQLLDVLRGFALCGIIFMNIPSLLHIPYDIPVSEEHLRSTLNIIFEQRFFVIFSLLFGTGAFIFTDNATKKSQNPYPLFLRRILFLLIVGALHQYFQPGEALLIYAILSIPLLPSFLLKPIFNLSLALIAFAIASYMVPVYFSALGLFYLGYYLGQIRFFESPTKYRALLIYTLLAGSILAICSNIFLVEQYKATSYYSKILTFTGLAQSFSYMSILTLLYCYLPPAKKLLNTLADMGRMAFTNYIMQTFLVLMIGYFWRGDFFYTHTIYIGVGILLLQIIYSQIWFRFFPMGPLEWLWRNWTYGYFFRRSRQKKTTETI